MIDLRQFEKLEKFCNYEDLEYGGTSTDGIAYQHKKNCRIYCFKHVDLERGRGDMVECKKDQCKHYIYVNPNQTPLLGYFREQLPKLKDVSDPKNLIELRTK